MVFFDQIENFESNIFFEFLWNRNIYFTKLIIISDFWSSVCLLDLLKKSSVRWQFWLIRLDWWFWWICVKIKFSKEKSKSGFRSLFKSKSHNFLGSRFSKPPCFPTLLIILKSGIHAPSLIFLHSSAGGQLQSGHCVRVVRESLPKIDFNLLNSGPSKSPQMVSNGSFGDIIGIWVTVGSGTFALSRDFSTKIEIKIHNFWIMKFWNFFNDIKLLNNLFPFGANQILGKI